MTEPAPAPTPAPPPASPPAPTLTDDTAGDVIDYLLSGLAGTEHESRILELQGAGK